MFPMLSDDDIPAYLWNTRARGAKSREERDCVSAAIGRDNGGRICCSGLCYKPSLVGGGEQEIMASESASTYGNYEARGKDLDRYDQYHSLLSLIHI